MTFLILVMCLVFIGSIQTTEQNDQLCSCVNNGVCSSFKQYPSCECPEGFIGDKCQINALKINQKNLDLQLTENYTYFYYQPTQTNYYQLNIKLCVPQQSQQVTSLIFLQVQRSTGKIKEQPSIYQTSPLHFYGGQRLCRYFSTHFIPIKKKLNQKFQKIIFGISLKGQNALASNWLSFLDREVGINSQNKNNPQIYVKKQTPKVQKISVSCQTNLYLSQNHWGTIVIIVSSITLIIASVIFVYTIKNRYNYTLSSQAILRAYNLNPEEFNYQIEHQVQKNDLSHFETIMPVQKYSSLQNKQRKAARKYPKNNLKRRIQMYLEEQQEQKKSEQNFNSQNQNKNSQKVSQSIETVCTICLINFQAEDKIRRTPCEHIYHSQCIDSWCQSTLNCPMCRHDLQFPHYRRRLYMQYLRAQLHNDAA